MRTMYSGKSHRILLFVLPFPYRNGKFVLLWQSPNRDYILVQPSVRYLQCSTIISRYAVRSDTEYTTVSMKNNDVINERVTENY